MRFVVIFDHSTEIAEVRNRLEPDHLRYLEEHHAEIPMAGGLRNEHGGSYVGGHGVSQEPIAKSPAWCGALSAWKLD